MKDLKKEVYEILKLVNKPSRYIGQEVGAIVKDWDSSSLKTCILFPDMYEVAVSNLGHRILYHLINNADGEKKYIADRTYAPAPDFKDQLEKNDIPLYGVDYFRPLNEYDVIAVSLQYELSYPTILKMFEMGRIGVKNNDRAEDSPIIVAGGPGAYNPEPLTDFIDVFIIGDGEDILLEILDKISELKTQGFSRRDILKELLNIEGVYVPDFYRVKIEFSLPEPIDSTVGKMVKKRVSVLNDKNYPVDYPVPYSASVHDRAVVEIRRGCGRMCRFCQPCFVNLPVRERAKDSITSLVDCVLANTGYDEYSLLSLSSNDYEGIEDLVSELNQKHVPTGASISLPSQRADSFSIELAELVQSVRKSTLTFAPEAGSQRLRNVINKNLTNDQVFEAVLSAYKAGWVSAKLYFMIGLPTETYEDLDAILSLLLEIKYKSKQIRQELGLKKHLDLNCTMSIFVPKPFTPFQWFGQDSMKQIDEKIKYLRTKIKEMPGMRGVRLNFHDSFLCQLEAVFTRGDRSLNKVIELAWKKGSYLDAWNEHFNKPLWHEAAEESGISFEEYSTRKISPEKPLPWDFIDIGVKKDWLITEYNSSLKDMASIPCDEKCSACGVCQSFDVKKDLQSVKSKAEVSDINHVEFDRSNRETFRYRMQITKKDALKYISHLDWLSLIYKAVRKSKLNVAFTQGFNPSPKIAIGVALPLFIEGENEYVDIELYDEVTASDLMRLLNNSLPESSKILKVSNIPKSSVSLDHIIEWAKYESVIEKNKLLKNYDLAGNINSVLSKDEILIEKTNKKGLKKQINIRPSVHSIELKEDEDNYKLTFILKTGQGNSLSEPNNPEAQIKSVRADVFLETITPEIDWEVKRVSLLNKNLKSLL